MVEQGSFRRAANKLDVPQSTVSRRVQILERRIGVSIFDRDHTGVTVTAAGRRFIDEALIGAQHFSNAMGALNSMRQGRAGCLRLGMFASLSGGFLRSLVAEYHARFPEIECHFEECTAQASLGGVLDGRLDVAFVTGTPIAPRCDTIALWDERLFAAVRRESILATRGEISWKDLRNERFIVTTGGRGPEIEDLLVSKLSRPGFRPDIQVHSVSRETILHMVVLGFGVGIVTESAVVEMMHGAKLCRLIDEDCSVHSSAVWLISNTNPALRSLVLLARTKLDNAGEGRATSY